jgi:hypothetical protein
MGADAKPVGQVLAPDPYDVMTVRFSEDLDFTVVDGGPETPA